MKKLLLTCALGGAVALMAKADITLTLNPGNSFVIAPGLLYEWNYDVYADGNDFAGGEALAVMLDLGGVNGYIAGGIGSTTQYWDDFGGTAFILNETLDNGYTGADNALKWDLEMVYDGDPMSPSGGLYLGYLTFQSTLDWAGAISGSVYWEWNNFIDDPLNGTTSTLVPASSPIEDGGGGGNEVPEASTVVSTAFMGLAGAAYVIRRRRAQAVKA